MKLTLASILALLALLGTSASAAKPAAPPAVPAFYMKMGDGDIPKIKPVGEGDMCKAMKNMMQWLQEGKICLDKQDPGIGKDHGIMQLRLLVHYYSGLHNQELDPNKVDKSGLEKLGKLVSHNNIENLILHPGVEGAEVPKESHPMGYVMRHVNEDVLRGINSEAFVVLLEGVTHGFQEVAGKDFNAENLIWLLNVLGNSELITENMETILNALDEHKVLTKRLNDQVLTALMANPEECDKMTHDNFLLTMSPHQISLLSGPCLSKIGNLNAIRCGIDIRALPVDVLKKVNLALHSTCYARMTKDQVANFAAELDKESDEPPCEKFILTEGLIANGSGMRSDCFRNIIAAAPEGKFSTPYWSFLPPDILKDIDEDTISLVMATNALEMSAEQKQPLFANAEHCDKVQDGMLKYRSKGVTVSDECFNGLQIENKKDALVNARVSDTVLAKADRKMLGDIGMVIFDKMSSVHNLTAIIRNMGSQVEEENHPCRLFRNNKDAFLDSVVRYHLSEACLKAMGNIAWELDDFDKMSKHLASMLDMKKVVQSIPADKIADLGADKFNKLQKKFHLCKYLTLDQFKAIANQRNFVNSIHAGCLSEMDEGLLKSLTSAEVKFVQPEAFEGVKRDHVTSGILNKDQDAKLAG